MVGQLASSQAEAIASQIVAQRLVDGLAAQRQQFVDFLSPVWRGEITKPAFLGDLDLKTTAIEEFVANLLPEAMTRESVAKYLQEGDEDSAMAKFGAAVRQDLEALQVKMSKFNPEISRLRRKTIDLREAYYQRKLYPDTNSTLRFTYGKVTGYSPRDGVEFRFFTSPEGIREKHTGEEPFDAPAKVLELVAKKDWGRYADEKLGTLPVCFLTDNDITGGNSGSPIMNGKGELIGLAFDGNYEAMTSDFQYSDRTSRTINVDIRYVLWCTEKVAELGRLIEEMDLSSQELKAQGRFNLSGLEQNPRPVG